MYYLWKIEQELQKRKVSPSSHDIDWSAIIREAFFFEGCNGNNSFLRKEETGLHIPRITLGTINDLKAGNQIVFCDNQDDEYLQCTGLDAHICSKTNSGIPLFICDNHNLVLEAWQLFKEKKPTLIHIDQHKDDAKINCLPNASIYHTRICDYIDYAQKNEWIQFDYFSFVESQDLPQLEQASQSTNKIVNIDIDFFVKEVTMLTLEEKIEVITKSCQGASLITIATSPGFIEQELAVGITKLLARYL